MKNITNDSNNNNNNNNSVSTNNLTLTGFNQYDILYIADTNGTVDGLNNTPIDYILHSSNTGPQFRNFINVADITTTNIKLTGLNNGSIPIGSLNNGTFSQLPIGNQGETLITNAGFPYWTNRLYATQWAGLGNRDLYINNTGEILPKLANQCNNFSANSSTPINTIASDIITFNTNYTAGVYYKIIFNALLSLPAGSVCQIKINISQLNEFGPLTGNIITSPPTSLSYYPIHFERIYLSPSTYSFSSTINAVCTAAGGFLYQQKIIVEQFIF